MEFPEGNENSVEFYSLGCMFMMHVSNQFQMFVGMSVCFCRMQNMRLTNFMLSP